jgi:hypothetical protein
LGVVGPWVLAALAPAFGLFAFVGSLVDTTTFWPVPIEVPPVAMALLALSATTYAGVGALLATRLPGNPIGWLLLAMGEAVAVTLAAVAYVALDLPGAAWAHWLTWWVCSIALVLVAYVLLLFPDGRLPGRRWRPALWLTHVSLVTMVLSGVFAPFPAEAPFPNPVPVTPVGEAANSAVWWVLMAAAIVSAAASFVARYRRTTGVERVQLEWFAFAASLVAVGYVVDTLLWGATQRFDVQLAGAGALILVLCFTAVPVACGIAILRYRLYDIDLVVSRTVSYLLLTGIVVGVYVGVVTAASAVLPDGASQAVVAGATLAAAAAFEPARRHVQRVVDQRFNRQRYDAQRLIERYADGLRHTVDLDAAQRQLVAVVQGSVEPTTVALWVRPRQQVSSS